MDQLATIITALLTVASPLAIAWVKSESWSKVARVGLPIIVSVVLAMVYLFVTGTITQGGDVITTILIVYGAQQLAYTTIMRWWSTILEQHGEAPAAADGPKHSTGD